MQRACSDQIDQAALFKSLRDTPKPQSLALDNTGRLIIFNATAHAVCVLTDTNGVGHRPIVNISLEVEEARWQEGDPIMSSEKFSKQQFRAMLEADVEKQNLTFALNATQLDTIYNSAIIMPTWHGHKDEAIRFLKSMIRNCIDCDRWSINLVVVSEDMPLFEHYVYENGNQSLRYFLPGLRLLEFERLAFPHYNDTINVAEKVAEQGKFVLQDFKKNYGCLATGKKYCSLVDSEGIVVRTTLYADVVKEYLDAPFVIHDSHGRNADDPFSATVRGLAPLKELLGVPNLAKVGWLLSYYGWIMDASVFDAVATIIANKYPTVNGIPAPYFIEMAYYIYIWAQLGPVPGPAYTFIESEQVIGERTYNATWRQVIEKDPERRLGIGLVEQIGWWMHDFPEMINPTAKRWNELGLRYFRAVETDYSPLNEAFVAMAKSVRLAVSSQPLGLYQAAMAGMLNL
ncbi:hypothetical protein MBLNU457_g0433t1 [Dothideomycetes sp. NU457]